MKIIDYKSQKELVQSILERNQFEFQQVNEAVKDILSRVKSYGDEALRAYTKTFDGILLDEFRVSEIEFQEAFQEVDEVLISDLRFAYQNIYQYHQKQTFQPFEIKNGTDIYLAQRVLPIENVGMYVPGGTAKYPSTVLMNAIPAKIAGVKRLVMVTPPKPNGKIDALTLVAAQIAGVDEVYKIGGAQSIAALAYGTKSIRPVSKIVGPGNLYVAMAKKMLSGYVGIDMVAGPSEVLIIADENANPNFIAADLMAQAEHDIFASAILITNSLKLANEVLKAIQVQKVNLSRKETIEKAFNDFGAIIIVDDIEDAFHLANQIAPEHLEIMVEDPFTSLSKIKNAGSIFLGSYTPEPVGDYVAGPNHTLPTSGTAKFASGLSTQDFQKKSSVTFYSKDALEKAKDSIIRLAEAEGLDAHSYAIKSRF
jgi:histidinol dehydrogenase